MTRWRPERRRWDYDAYIASTAPDPPIWASALIALGWLARRAWEAWR